MSDKRQKTKERKICYGSIEEINYINNKLAQEHLSPDQMIISKKSCESCRAQIKARLAKEIKQAWQQFDKDGNPTEDDSKVTEKIYFISESKLEKLLRKRW